MRQDMEASLSYSVDPVLSGHVHAYERVRPVYDGCLDACGPVYLNLGDGGNREGVRAMVEPQPPWSAFRESSFGAGLLRLENSTHAKYTAARRVREAQARAPTSTPRLRDGHVGQVGQPRQLGDRRRRGRRNVDRPAAARLPHACPLPAAKCEMPPAPPTPPPPTPPPPTRRRRRRPAAGARLSGAVVTVAAFVSGLGGAVIGAVGVGFPCAARARRRWRRRRSARAASCTTARRSRAWMLPSVPTDDAAGAGEWRGDAGLVASEIAGRVRWADLIVVLAI